MRNRVTTPRLPKGPIIVVSPRLWRQGPHTVILPKPGPRRTWQITAGMVVAGFLLLILTGTVLLSLPMARAPGQSFNLLTSFFTATSAVCVTGLAVIDTGSGWSFFGQAVILVLIQLGGLGIMTAGMIILILSGRGVSLADRFALQETSGLPKVRTVISLVWMTVALTIVFELAGTALLFWRLGDPSFVAGLPFGAPTDARLWQALFHAVSAFNNAGFDIRGDGASLATFARDPGALLILAGLIIGGGLGPLVFLDVLSSRGPRRLSIQTRVVLLTTVVLLLAGFAGTLASEFSNPATLGALPTNDRVMNAFFHSVNTRTAGYTTVPTGMLKDETQLLTMLLMAIGGATGSTAGGIKVGTFFLLMMATLASARGFNTVRFGNREFSHVLVYRALGVATLFLGAVILGTLALTITDEQAFRSLLFEVVSALGTVGLSTGITADLSVAGKIVLSILMFVGRLGPLALVYTLTKAAREPVYRLPEADLGIG